MQFRILYKNAELEAAVHCEHNGRWRLLSETIPHTAE